jgi:hypothetical protein
MESLRRLLLPPTVDNVATPATQITVKKQPLGRSMTVKAVPPRTPKGTRAVSDTRENKTAHVEANKAGSVENMKGKISPDPVIFDDLSRVTRLLGRTHDPPHFDHMADI